MKTVITTKIFFILFFLLSALPAVAQIDNPDEDEDPGNASLDPPTPINDYILPMIVMGVATGYYLIRKREFQLKK